MCYDVIDTQASLRVRRPNRVTGCVEAADYSCTAQHVFLAGNGLDTIDLAEKDLPTQTT